MICFTFSVPRLVPLSVRMTEEWRKKNREGIVRRGSYERSRRTLASAAEVPAMIHTENISKISILERYSYGGPFDRIFRFARKRRDNLRRHFEMEYVSPRLSCASHQSGDAGWCMSFAAQMDRLDCDVTTSPAGGGGVTGAEPADM
jgi:hypothetical protein